MAQGDTVILRVVGRYQGQNIVNNLHYMITDQESAETQILQNLCAAWNTAIPTTWLARHIDTYTLVGIKAFNKTGPIKVPGFLSIDSPGVVVGVETPSPVCRTITLYTASINYRRRGRIMLSGSADGMFNDDDGAVTTSEVDSLTALGQLLNSTLQSGNDAWVLAIPPTDLLPNEVITSVRGRTTPSVIRSRRIRQFLVG